MTPTALVLSLLGGGAVTITVGALILLMKLKQAGRDEVLKDINEKRAVNAEKQGKIMAENRTADAAGDRLGGGTF